MSGTESIVNVKHIFLTISALRSPKMTFFKKDNLIPTGLYFLLMLWPYKLWAEYASTLSVSGEIDIEMTSIRHSTVPNFCPLCISLDY